MTLINSIEEINELIARLEKTHIYVLDVETHKTDTFDNKTLLGVAIGVPDGLDLDTWYVRPEHFHLLFPVLSDREMVGFSLMFDLEICEQAGFKHTGFVWDVLIMHHLCNENEFAFSLDALSLRYLKQRKGVMWGKETVDIVKLEKIFGWNNIPIEFMSVYAEQDIQLTWKLWIRIRSELQKQGLGKVYVPASRYVKSLQHVVQEGLLIDWNKLGELRAEAVIEMSRLELLIGFKPSKRGLLHRKLYTTEDGGFGFPVVKWTTPKSGAKPQAAQDTEALNRLIGRFAEHREYLNAVLEWRRLSKAVSTWYDGFELRRTASNRLHPGLKQHGTKTGRLSCAEPNLQQIPRERGRVKSLFLDPPGYVLLECDYAGVELRGGSYYAMKIGNDALMYEMFKENADVHAATATSIGAYSQVANPREARQVGKTGNFAWIYGVGAETFATQLYKLYNFNCSIEQAEEWTQLFHETYPGFRRVNKLYATFHQRHGYVELFNKRRARIAPEVPGARPKHHIAFNRVVQGGCGQVLMYAINELSKQIKDGRLKARMCNTVHDCVWFYVKPEDLDIATQQIIDIMRFVPEKVFGIPFEVEPQLLNNEHAEWKEGKWLLPLKV